MQLEAGEPPQQIMLARYYETGLGRFLSVDPAATSARPKAPQTWNRYEYARNNPLLNVDRDGQVEASFLGEFRNQGCWANVPNTPGGPLTFTLVAGADVVGGLIGAGLSFGVAGDTSLNFAIVGTASFKAGAGLFVDVGLSGGVQSGTVGDLSGQHQSLTLAGADGPGGSLGVSLDDTGAPSVQKGIDVGPKLGVGAVVTVDFSATGVVSVIGDKKKSKKPSEGERGILTDDDLPHQLSPEIQVGN